MALPASFNSIVVKSLSLDGIEYVSKDSPFSLDNLKEDEFIAKLLYTPISDYSIHEIQGHFPSAKIPFTPGFEATGQIIAGKGDNVQALIGRNASFKVISGGAWQEYVLGSLKQALIHSPETDLRQVSASCYVNPLTVAGMLELVKKYKPKAVINTGAASSIGRMFQAGCNQLGVTVVNIVRTDSKAAKLLTELQAGSHVLSYENIETFRTQFAELASKLEATLCFECVGGAIAGVIFNALPPNSTLLVYGTLSGQDISGVNGVQVRWANKKIEGYLAYTWFEKLSEKEKKEVHEFIQTNEASIFTTKIQGEYTLAQTKEAIEFFSKDMSAGKVILKI